ncbi:MAG: four helix bundle protein [Gemmatimonadota bacterium]|nr:four helix bundle protein [Gemmatimonadota bacterium]
MSTAIEARPLDGRIRSYRDLRVWQASVDIVVEVAMVVKQLPRREDFGLRGQMQRAAASIPANIAEGHGREHLGDYLRHLSIATGSLMELETHTYLAERLGFLSTEFAAPLLQRISDVSRMLAGLTKALRAKSSQPTSPPP